MRSPIGFTHENSKTGNVTKVGLKKRNFLVGWAHIPNLTYQDLTNNSMKMPFWSHLDLKLSPNHQWFFRDCLILFSRT